MIRISSRDNIDRLRGLQHIHNNLLNKMFNELGSRFQNKEISDRFWEVMPAEIRDRYKNSIRKLRKEIRDIISEYPEYYSQYIRKNLPYFKKVERQQRQQNVIQFPEEQQQLAEANL